MNLLDMVLNAQNGGMVSQLARNFGLGSDDAKNAVGQLLPSLSRGIQNNISKPGGLDALLGALQKGNHQRYLDNPEMLGSSDTVNDGNNILGHILGSKDVSRNVAGHASTRTGIDAGILKKMLPLVATMAMGAISKQAAGSASMSGLAAGSGQQSSSLLGGLTSFLDADRDGSVADDLLNLAKKFF
ncbi:MAG: DUF937 domain-containing protein [Desulfobulbales bacterium]|nr:DUF937 domain-containing protein [Desulfobulbales bacterium]